MKHMKKTITLSLILMFVVAYSAFAEYKYKVNRDHLGGNVTPVEAYQMIKKDPQHTFIIDCRTRAEYQFVGHAEGAYNIPIRFPSTVVGEKGYNEVSNPKFGEVLLTRLIPKATL